MNNYSFAVSAVDMFAALDCEADRAESEHMHGVADRQRASALHIRNAVDHMQKFCPEGYRVETKLVFEFVPAVNAVLRDECR